MGRRLRNATRRRGFFGDTRGGMAYGVCRLTLQLGQWAVRCPCGQGCHVLHARCVVGALARSTAPAQAPRWYPTVNSGAQHPRRDALEAAVLADPGLRNRARRMGRGNIGDEGLRTRRLWYGWDQNSLGMGPPLDAVLLDDLGQRFAIGKKYSRSWQAHMRARAFMYLTSSTTLWASTYQNGTQRTELAPAGD